MTSNPVAEFVAFDLETTGLAPQDDRIIELGAVRFDATGQIVATFERLVNPLRSSGLVSHSLHGISDDALAVAPSVEVVLPEFLAFFGDPSTTTLLAHHAAFDAGFLGHELIRAGRPLPDFGVVDTLAWSRRRWPRFGSHKLGALASRVGFDEAALHRALVDSLRVRAIYLGLLADDPDRSDHPPLAYPIFDGAGPPPIPRGWEPVAAAIERDQMIQIEYQGGTRGLAPRAVQPRGFALRGGVAYLLAICQLDGKTKEFQIDRVRRFAVADSVP